MTRHSKLKSVVFVLIGLLCFCHLSHASGLNKKKISPLTTKGDVYTFTTLDARLGVGADGTVLSADSSTSTGLKWVSPSTGSGTVTNSGALTSNAVIIGGGGTTISAITADTSVVNFLGSTATSPAFRRITSSDVIGTQSVAGGGTGITSGTSGGIPYFSNAGLMASSAALTSNAVVIGGGAGTTPSTITADTSTAHALFSTATSPAFRNVNAADIVGLLGGSNTLVQFNDSGSPGADPTFQYYKSSNTFVVSGDAGQSGSTYALIISSDTGNTVSNISHDGSAFFNKVQVSNDIAVADGGTGLSSGTSGGVLAYTAAGTLASSSALTANAVVIGGGAGAVPLTITADTSTAHALFSTATSPAFRQLNISDIVGGIAGSNTQVQFNDAGIAGADPTFQYYKGSNTLVVSGDTGQSGSTYAIIVSSDTGTPVATISHDGSAFFNKVQVSNDIAVADGGTGLSSGTSGGVLAYTAAGTLASSAALTANAVVVGGGAGVVPLTITADTGTSHALFATGTTPAFRNINMGDLNGTLGVANGGTGNTSGTALRMAYYSNATTLAPAGGLVSTDGTRVAIGPGTSPTVSLDVAGNSRNVPFTLTDGASIDLDASRSNFFIVTLTGQPRNLANATNAVIGQRIILMVSQDATGSRKMGFGTNYKFGTTVTTFDASTVANSIDFIGMIYNGVSMDIVSVAQGYR